MSRMYSRRPHPQLSEYGYDVVEFNTKVRHELMVSKDVGEDELVELIAEHLGEYERAYPHAKSEEFWEWLEGVRGRRRGGTA